MEIITVRKNEIASLSKFAQEVFIDYYNNLIGSNQANYMADLFLSEKAIKQLIEQGAVFRVLLEKEQYIGFSEYLKDGDRLFLSKLYLLREYRGKRLGRMLINDCITYAKNNQLKAIYLTVNKHNTNSYQMYLHMGFENIDSQVNDIGNGYVMDDYIMQLKIEY